MCFWMGQAISVGSHKQLRRTEILLEIYQYLSHTLIDISPSSLSHLHFASHRVLNEGTYCCVELNLLFLALCLKFSQEHNDRVSSKPGYHHALFNLTRQRALTQNSPIHGYIHSRVLCDEVNDSEMIQFFLTSVFYVSMSTLLYHLMQLLTFFSVHTYTPTSTHLVFKISVVWTS